MWKVVLVHLPVVPSERDGTVVSPSEDRLHRRGTRRDCKGDMEYSLNILRNSPSGRIHIIRGIEPLVQDVLPEQPVSGSVVQSGGAVRNNYSQRILLSELHDDSEDRLTQWCNLLQSFRNVEILWVHDELSWDIACSLLLGSEGELLSPSRVLLLQLKELQCTATGDTPDAGNAFAAFIDARGAAGQPVCLVNATIPIPHLASTGVSSRTNQS